MTKSNDDKLVNISIGNHNVAGIADFIDLLLFDLREVGRIPILSNQFMPTNYNVVIEAFDADMVRVIKKSFSKNDPRLIMIATEIVKDGLLDSASPSPEEDVDGWYDATADHWVERTNNFFEIVEYFGHIICVSEEIYNSLTALNLKAKLVYWKPRFTGMREIFERGEEFFKNYWISQNVKHTKTHRLMFSGSLTPYRTEQIDKLVDAGETVLVCKQDTPHNVRYEFSRQSGLSFGPKHYRSTVQLSKMRLLWCLNNFFPIIMQDCQGKTDLDPYCVFYRDEDDLLTKCADMNSTYFECLTKNFQFCCDTAKTNSPFTEILEG